MTATLMALDLTAYCDESGTQGHDLILAGYLAPASEWLRVEEAWSGALRDADLSEFKMQDCHQGHGEFRGRADRVELRERFFSIIESAEVDGFAVRIDLTTFDEVRKKLERSIRPGYNKVYLHGFSALLQFMTGLAADHPVNERIEFVFDENDEFSGRALHMYKALMAMPALAYRDRLGAISFEDSKRLTPLQAADTLAYRVHRDLFDALPVQRSVVQGFQKVRRVNVALLGSAAIVDEPESG